MRIIGMFAFLRLLVGLASKASAAGTELGSAIDKHAYPEYYTGGVAINVGAATGTPDSFSAVYTLKHCDTSGGSYVAVTDLVTGDSATVTATAAGSYEIPFKPAATKRYLKVERVVTFVNGTTPALPNGALVLLGDSKYGPA